MKEEKKKLPYVAPKIRSGETYERLALACTGAAGRPVQYEKCVVAKQGFDPMSGCVNCNGS